MERETIPSGVVPSEIAVYDRPDRKYVRGSYGPRLRVLENELRDLCWELERKRDLRCVFTYAYATWLQCLGQVLHESDLDDAGWTLRIADGFVLTYQKAVEAYGTDRRAEPWTTVFEALLTGRATVMESLVFSLFAHLVHDLPLVLNEEGLKGRGNRSHIHDYERVNQAMSDSTDIVIDCVAKRYYPRLPWLRHISPRIEALLVLESARVFRGMAWYTTMRLRDSTSSPSAQERMIEVPREIVLKVTQPGDRVIRWARAPLCSLEARFRSWPSSFPERDTEL